LIKPHDITIADQIPIHIIPNPQFRTQPSASFLTENQKDLIFLKLKQDHTKGYSVALIKKKNII